VEEKKGVYYPSARILKTRHIQFLTCIKSNSKSHWLIRITYFKLFHTDLMRRRCLLQNELAGSPRKRWSMCNALNMKSSALHARIEGRTTAMAAHMGRPERHPSSSSPQAPLPWSPCQHWTSMCTFRSKCEHISTLNRMTNEPRLGLFARFELDRAGS
jgi:hypothetical protein